MGYGSEKILPYNKEEHKGIQVRRMFDAIAEKYDLLNHTLSFGFDKGWRRKGINYLRPFMPKHRRFGYLDAKRVKCQSNYRCRYLGRNDGYRPAESG